MGKNVESFATARSNLLLEAAVGRSTFFVARYFTGTFLTSPLAPGGKLGPQG
jgi:hypothetical protein